jgi:dienelactone hydrolase
MKSAWRLLILVSLSWSAVGAAQVNKEAVSFNSLSGSGGQAAATIPAELYVPADRPGPFAAVVLVHGSGGVSDFREHWYAREFSARGYAALVIDSFKPRGVTSTVEDQSRVTTTQMLQDAYGALAFLAADKRIDPARIGVMGFSKGGTVTLWSAMKAVGDRFAAAGGVKQRFAFHLPFYPGCNFQHRSLATTGSPILMMLGELDDYTSPQTCMDYAKRLQSGGVKAEFQVVPGAYHAWETETGPHYLARAERVRRCEYLIEDDGRYTWVKDKDGQPVTPATMGPRDVAAHSRSECRNYGPKIGGGNAEMKRKALAEAFAFLERHGLMRQ